MTRAAQNELIMLVRESVLEEAEKALQEAIRERIAGNADADADATKRFHTLRKASKQLVQVTALLADMDLKLYY